MDSVSGSKTVTYTINGYGCICTSGPNNGNAIESEQYDNILCKYINKNATRYRVDMRYMWRGSVII